MSRRLLAGLAGVALAALAATSAFAAYPPTVTTVSASAPVTKTSDAAAMGFTISAKVMGDTAQGTDVGLPGLTVNWDYSASSGVAVTIDPMSAVTDNNGVVTATATIVCNACSVTFTATEESSGQSGSAVTKVTSEGLPNTAVTTSGISGSFLATLLAALAIVAGAILMARQVVVSRR